MPSRYCFRKAGSRLRQKPLTRVIIDKNLNFYTAFGNEDEMPIDLEELPAFLQKVCREGNPICMWLFMRMRLCLTAKIVRVLNIANENHFKMVLATRPPEKENVKAVKHEEKNKITGLIGTIVLHAVLLILLLVIAIRRPQMQEEGGVPVILGNTELSQGNADPYTLTDVDIMNEPEAPAPDISEPEPVPAVDVKEEVITQTEEETVAVPKKEPKKETKKRDSQEGNSQKGKFQRKIL